MIIICVKDRYIPLAKPSAMINDFCPWLGEGSTSLWEEKARRPLKSDDPDYADAHNFSQRDFGLHRGDVPTRADDKPTFASPWLYRRKFLPALALKS